MTDKVQKILSEIATRKLCTMDEHMTFYNDKAKEDYRFLSEIEELINTLQKESVSEDFETALEKKVREAQNWTYIEEEGGEYPLNEEFGADDLEEFARWGADWVRNNEKEPVSEELEKAIDKYLDNGMALRLNWKYYDITFKASGLINFANYIAQWHKEQMMKDAVSAYIRRNRYTKTNVLHGFDVTCDAVQRFKDKDKVKVIVIKED